MLLQLSTSLWDAALVLRPSSNEKWQCWTAASAMKLSLTVLAPLLLGTSHSLFTIPLLYSQFSGFRPFLSLHLFVNFLVLSIDTRMESTLISHYPIWFCQFSTDILRFQLIAYHFTLLFAEYLISWEISYQLWLILIQLGQYQSHSVKFAKCLL